MRCMFRLCDRLVRSRTGRPCRATIPVAGRRRPSTSGRPPVVSGSRLLSHCNPRSRRCLSGRHERCRPFTDRHDLGGTRETTPRSRRHRCNHAGARRLVRRQSGDGRSGAAGERAVRRGGPLRRRIGELGVQRLLPALLVPARPAPSRHVAGSARSSDRRAGSASTSETDPRGTYPLTRWVGARRRDVQRSEASLRCVATNRITSEGEARVRPTSRRRRSTPASSRGGGPCGRGRRRRCGGYRR